MTFYNIIFGYLFIAACHKFILACASGSSNAWVAAVLALMVINDTVHTSNYFEGVQAEQREYKLIMKWLDLVSFFVLGLAVISISPEDDDMRKLMVRKWNWIDYPSFTWFLLVIYWLVACAWNYFDDAYSNKWVQPWPMGVKVYSVSIVVVFVVNWLFLREYGSMDDVPKAFPIAALIVPGVYTLWLKHYYVYHSALPPIGPNIVKGEHPDIERAKQDLSAALQEQNTKCEELRQLRRACATAIAQVKVKQRQLMVAKSKVRKQLKA